MVLETGLGGRLDATNIPDLRAVATAISTISRDHEKILGSRLEEIAGEKAGIIRPHVPVVVAQQEAGAMRVIGERADALGAPLFRVGEDVSATLRKAAIADRPELGQRLDMETWRSLYPDIVLSLLGEHQAANAALALGLAELFLEGVNSGPIDSLALKRAWRGLVLPARLEVASRRPWLVVDGAHNPASAWAAAETVANSFTTGERALVFGVADDKDAATMLRIFAPLFATVVLTPFASPRSADVRKLAEFMAKEFPAIKAVVAEGPADALNLAREAVTVDGLILVAGSLYLAGEIRAICKREAAGRTGK